MDDKEALEYLELLDEALELLTEKRERMEEVLKSRSGAKKIKYLNRVKEIDLLLKENDAHLRNYSYLKS